MKYYQGNFRPKNPNKYLGDIKSIYYRSGMELKVFMWCDGNAAIKAWNSEEIVIPYRCPVDNKVHRYFVDLMIMFENGKKMLIEIKPKRFTIPPPATKNKKRFIREYLEYERNLAKWNMAEEFAKKHDIEFAVWTEETFKKLDI